MQNHKFAILSYFPHVSFQNKRNCTKGIICCVKVIFVTDGDTVQYCYTFLTHTFCQKLLKEVHFDRHLFLALWLLQIYFSRFLEFKARFGEGHLVTGFSRINGSLVGLVANCSSNNNNKGPLQAADGQKGSHFIQLCDSRDIPLVFLQNGSKLSPAGDAWALKERAKMSQHVAVATVPKIAINVSGLYADEMFTMCGPSFRPGFHFFWPQASMAKTSLATLEEISGRGKSQSNLKIEPGSAQFWASRSSHDGVILPRDTRLVLGECLRLSSLHRGPKARGERGQGRMTVRM